MSEAGSACLARLVVASNQGGRTLPALQPGLSDRPPGDSGWLDPRRNRRERERESERPGNWKESEGDSNPGAKRTDLQAARKQVCTCVLGAVRAVRAVQVEVLGGGMCKRVTLLKWGDQEMGWGCSCFLHVDTPMNNSPPSPGVVISAHGTSPGAPMIQK